MRIGFCGPKCIGKSTVARKLVGKLSNYSLVDNNAVDVFRFLKNRNINSFEVGELLMTSDLIKRYIEKDNVIAARTLFDVYYIYMHSYPIFKENIIKDMIDEIYSKYPLDILVIGLLKDKNLWWVTEDDARRRFYNSLPKFKEEIINDDIQLKTNLYQGLSAEDNILSKGLAKRVVLVPAPFNEETILGEIKNGV